MAKPRRGSSGADGKRDRGWDLFNAGASYADSIFKTALGDLEGSIEALRFALECKPDYAPAVFSLGTVEYQLGNKAEARRLFDSLLSYPPDTPELIPLIDHAGEFLIRSRDHEEGLDLYRAAALRFPDVAVFHQGIGCCAGNRGLHEEAIEASRRALALEPDNQKLVNDRGWSLLEAARLADAEQMLARAVEMDPADDLARNNLRTCRSKLRRQAAPPSRRKHREAPPKRVAAPTPPRTEARE